MAKHYSRDEIIRNMRKASIDKQLAWKTAWTSISIVVAYSLWKNEHFGAKKLAAISMEIENLNEKRMAGEIDFDAIRKHHADDFDIEIREAYVTDDDIMARKGSFSYNMARHYVYTQNVNTEYHSIYYTLLFHVLDTKYGYKKMRMNRVKDGIIKTAHSFEAGMLDTWITELRDYCGIVYEMPHL